MCDKLINKSKDNEKAARFLFNKKLHFPTIVHCSYYSCYQLMSYLLEIYLNRDYKSLKNESSYHQDNIHSTSIKTIFKDLYVYDEDKASDFNDKMGELREMRICSDYHNKEIDLSYSLKAIVLLGNIKEILKEKYNYAS